jgi:hypothetical protein
MIKISRMTIENKYFKEPRIKSKARNLILHLYRKNIFFIFLIFALNIILIQSSFSQESEHLFNLGPEARTSEFYHWYLDSLSRNKDPLKESPNTISNYIAGDLIKEINSKISSDAGLESDYFTKSQDYIDEWVTHINVKMTKIDKSGASVVVTLGESQNEISKLDVLLIKQKGEWKIYKITKSK